MFHKQSFEIRRKIKSDFFDRSSTLNILLLLLLLLLLFLLIKAFNVDAESIGSIQYLSTGTFMKNAVTSQGTRISSSLIGICWILFILLVLGFSFLSSHFVNCKLYVPVADRIGGMDNTAHFLGCFWKAI